MTGTTHAAQRNDANAAISPREAALVGALKAFARSPPTARVNRPTRTRSTPPRQAPDRLPTASLSTNVRSIELTKPPPRPAVGLKPHITRSSSRRQVPHGADDRLNDGAPDESRIPSTSSLVHLFEKRGKAKADDGPSATAKQEQPEAHTYTPEEDETREDSFLSTDFLPQRRNVDKEDHLGGMSSPDTFISAREAFSPFKAPPTVTSHKSAPPPRLKGASKAPLHTAIQPEWPSSTHITGSWQTAFQAIPTEQPPRPRTLSGTPHDTLSPSITATYHQMNPRRMSTLKTGDSLANAIVAGSLASSRAPSPSKLAPPVPTVRRSRSHSMFNRPPSPSKKPTGMRQTLRKGPNDSSSSSESDGDPYGKHKKKRHIRKHPNKHAEGDRKRWRDAVTERERKRYEGVWAANKGLMVAYTPEEQEILSTQHTNEAVCAEVRESAAATVSGIVAKDIWTRSRLPGHVLEEIWDLVDGSKSGRLTKEEFVVGLWLIDQRLKGRKLPTRVSDSVWYSVRLLQGIKIRKK